MSQSKLLTERRFAPFFWTQFFGAFNDNAFKQAILIYFTATLSAAEASTLSNVAVGLFIAPYFFFSATAGQLAEKWEKARLIRATKLLEVVVMIAACVGFYTGNQVILLALLTLLGVQATLFGPVKFAILPKILREDELIGGNGLVEMGTYVAILVGQIAGAELVASGEHGREIVSAVMLVIAVAGYLSARAIPPVASDVPDLPISANLVGETWKTISFAMERPAVWRSVLGISWFWFFGALLLSQLPVFATHVLGGTTTVTTLLLVVFSLGVGIGSLLCERLSMGHIEIGLVPFGAFGLSLFGLDLFLATEWHSASPTPIGPIEVLTSLEHTRMLVDLLLVGVFGGLYSVPLYALVQHRSDPTKRSRIIAGLNVVSSLFLIASAALAIVCLGPLGMSIPELFLVGAVLNALVAVYIFSVVPEFLMRFVTWLMMRTMYRLRASGLESIPQEGPALVVCNHVSFVDGFILAAASKRPIRFVMYYRIYQLPFLNFLFRAGRAIPIGGKKEDPALMEAAFAEVKKALGEGELIGIFPEGMITYTGEMNPFRPGVERILEETPVPVVPMALRNLWGSWFSRRGGPAMAKRPRRFRSRIELVVGDVVPPEKATAEHLEAEVRRLRGDAR